MKSIFDASILLSEDTPSWPGDKKVTISQTDFIDKGDVCNISYITMGLHVGTHVDVPLHFYKDGKSTADIELERFMGRAKVFEIEEDVEVGAGHLKGMDIDEDDIVLLNIKKNEELLKKQEFCKDFVGISEEAAKYLVDLKVKGIGINYFSIEGFYAETYPVHQILLKNEITIIEGLNLQDVEPGEYQIYCFPLKFKGGNGSPTRAVLIRE